MITVQRHILRATFGIFLDQIYFETPALNRPDCLENLCPFVLTFNRLQYTFQIPPLLIIFHSFVHPFHSFIFTKCFIPVRVLMDPRNTGCEVWIQPEWATSPLQGTIHTFTHTFTTRNNWLEPYWVVFQLLVCFFKVGGNQAKPMRTWGEHVSP